MSSWFDLIYKIYDPNQTCKVLMQKEIMYKILTGTRWACCSVHFSRGSRANTSLQQKHTVSVTSHTPSPLRNNAKASSCKFTAVPAAAPPPSFFFSTSAWWLLIPLFVVDTRTYSGGTTLDVV